RSRTSAATLDIPESERGTWEILSYVFALLGLALVIGAARLTRQPVIDLAAARRARSAGSSDDDKDKAKADQNKNDKAKAKADKDKADDSDDKEAV
ncbi:MAG: hypothetical protein AAGC55_30335, partial [Myxococcota bacterium]